MASNGTATGGAFRSSFSKQFAKAATARRRRGPGADGRGGGGGKRA